MKIMLFAVGIVVGVVYGMIRVVKSAAQPLVPLVGLYEEGLISGGWLLRHPLGHWAIVP